MIPTPITKLLGIEYPVIQGGMAWVSRAHLASAVSNAGGLGVIGSSTMESGELSQEIDEVRKRTHRPFGVNVVIMSPEPEKKVKVCIEKRVPVVITSAGSPRLFTRMLKDAGVIVGHVVPSARLAKKTQEAGTDFIVAESVEAGGHDGVEEISNFTLIPLVRRTVKIPIVSAGGIVNGAQIAAAMILGADGVQMGTRFVASEECNAHERFKRGIIEADEVGTVFTARRYRPQRILKNSFAERVVELEQQGGTADDIRILYGPDRGRRGAIEGDWEEGYFNCGQGAVLIDKVLTIEEIFKQLLEEYKAAIKIVR